MVFGIWFEAVCVDCVDWIVYLFVRSMAGCFVLYFNILLVMSVLDLGLLGFVSYF